MKSRRGYVSHRSGQVHYRTYWPDSGKNNLVLVLSHQSPSSSLMFEAAYPHLTAANVMCVAVDTPGFGMSDVPDPRPSVEDYAEVFPAVLDHFNLKQAHFLGHHTGAANVTAFAARHPERVTSLILNGPPLFSEEERTERLKGYFGPVAPKEDGSHLVERWNGRLKATPGYTNLYAMQRNFLGTLLAGDTFWYGHKAAYEYDMMRDFKRLKTRTLLLTNTTEDLYQITQRARALRPDMAYAELKGGTHDIVDEQPEAWSAAVAAFIKQS